MILNNFSICQEVIPTLLYACEQAAIASSSLIGRGKKNEADALAVKALREILQTSHVGIEVVIGEGEMDEAPMLFIGEKLGQGEVKLDLAVDPLEGTNLCANNQPNSMTSAAIAPKGSLLKCPDCYMSKIAAGNVHENGVIHIDASLKENLRNLAAYKKKNIEDLSVIMLSRERHQEQIQEIRALGANVTLISDGDINGIISTTSFGKGADLYLGTGGAPEGVLAACALKVLGGVMMGRIICETEEQKQRAINYGFKDLSCILNVDDMVKDDVALILTGVTNGDINGGVSRCKKTGLLRCESIIFTSILNKKNVRKTQNYYI